MHSNLFYQGDCSERHSNPASDQQDDLSEYDSAEDEEFHDAKEEIELNDCQENEKNEDYGNIIQNSGNIENLICKEVHTFKRDEDNNNCTEVDENNEDEYDAEDEENDDNYDNDDDDDGDSDWITPNNIELVKRKIADELVEDFDNVTVACLTTDYAMQVI